MLIRAVLGALALAVPTSSLAAEGVALSGAAPVVCNADLGGAGQAQSGAVALGSLAEFCNDPGGYEVWIDYPAELAGATLVLGSERLTLTSAGTARVSTVNSPQNRVRPASLEGAQPTQNLILSIRVSPASGSQSTVAAR
jgi:hypothetical protein